MIRAHLAYARGLLRHKLGVIRGCGLACVPLWRGLLHDWSKLTPLEWSPYVRQFRNPDGSKRDVRNKDGSYDPAAQPQAFQLAWIHHQRNQHHWQAWVSIGDDGALTPMPIPEIHLREMVADWIGAGIAYNGRVDPRPWYEANGDKMVLHRSSRALLEEILLEVGSRLA